ncbi:hypothetical protein HMN09_00215300 [Mycena chlorophos]|uniref:Uncharacterized protein n=1 Tax=Mycena chlorophos TaxID=658473 RepID=A0A8H6TH56_MYCCL|nr:hypothetical protein HMN09_00215300 [Mycena chlorophos]
MSAASTPTAGSTVETIPIFSVARAPNLPQFDPAQSALVRAAAGAGDRLDVFCSVVDGQWVGRDLPLTGVVVGQKIILGPYTLRGKPFIGTAIKRANAGEESPTKRIKTEAAEVGVEVVRANAPRVIVISDSESDPEVDEDKDEVVDAQAKYIA